MAVKLCGGWRRDCSANKETAAVSVTSGEEAGLRGSGPGGPGPAAAASPKPPGPGRAGLGP